MYSCLLVLSLFTLPIPSGQGAVPTTTVRDELARYTLLRDRTILERPENLSILSIKAHISSGTKSLITEMSEATKEPNPIQKNLQVMALLNRYLNTERYLDLNASANIPLPYFRLREVQFLPHAFYTFNLGAQLSISNFGDVTNPRAQTYLKKEKAIGLSSEYRHEKYQGYFRLYQLTRSDVKSLLTYADIVENKSLIEFDSLNIEAQSYAVDLANTWNFKNKQLTAEVRELAPLPASVETHYGFRPLFHLNLRSNQTFWYYGGGLHYRRFYSLDNGLYAEAGITRHGTPRLDFSTRLSNESINLTPEITWGILHLRYGMRLQYRNPVDEMWVPATHFVILEFQYPG
ncbi:MAG: hypothetical protein A2X86_00595 [Bdellovibrionales bacterium GWA2_49_15]|nr:MAG: hypothetical protein A2X86_00595 [Bdellovibrionales bacterium GWA2_49_15]HAZ13237.1 hypothetical protein [Bdellovibrionales bacterium]